MLRDFWTGILKGILYGIILVAILHGIDSML